MGGAGFGGTGIHGGTGGVGGKAVLMGDGGAGGNGGQLIGKNGIDGFL